MSRTADTRSSPWTRAALCALLVLVPGVASAQGAPLAAVSGLPEALTAAPPPALRLADDTRIAPLAALSLAAIGAADELAALREHNRAGVLPLQVGFARPLPKVGTIRLDPTSAADPAALGGGLAEPLRDGGLAWGARLDVEGAFRLRARLTGVDLPAGARLWVWGEGEEPRGFGRELLAPDGSLWTPSVGGEVLHLEVEVPADSPEAAFDVSEVAEIFDLDAAGQPIVDGALFAPLGECLVDATCYGASTFSAIAVARKAIAHIEFMVGGQEFLCSGGLLNDLDAATTRWLFLTAHHCFSTQASAASVEAFWDDRTTSCNGSFPSLGSRPRSNGSTLRATGAASDFTLVEFGSVPGQRALLGWNANAAAVANGTTIFRLSHPVPNSVPYPQRLSRSVVRTTGVPVCQGIPRPAYLYSTLNLGGTFGGSSGAPAILDNGQVVGQLRGVCAPAGHDPNDGCDTANAENDGAFSQTFPKISAILNPSPGGGSSCVPNGTTLCVGAGGRFKVTSTYMSNAESGNGKAIALGTVGLSSGGAFYFFTSDNPEIFVKIVDLCAFTGSYGVFVAPLTNVQFTLTVRDVERGVTHSYSNPLGHPADAVGDTASFKTCP